MRWAGINFFSLNIFAIKLGEARHRRLYKLSFRQFGVKQVREGPIRKVITRFRAKSGDTKLTSYSADKIQFNGHECVLVVDIKTVQELLRHQNLKTTLEIYAKSMTEDKLAAQGMFLEELFRYDKKKTAAEVKSQRDLERIAPVVSSLQ
jgi:integrase